MRQAGYKADAQGRCKKACQDPLCASCADNGRNCYACVASSGTFSVYLSPKNGGQCRLVSTGLVAAARGAQHGGAEKGVWGEPVSTGTTTGTPTPHGAVLRRDYSLMHPTCPLPPSCSAHGQTARPAAATAAAQHATPGLRATAAAAAAGPAPRPSAPSAPPPPPSASSASRVTRSSAAPASPRAMSTSATSASQAMVSGRCLPSAAAFPPLPMPAMIPACTLPAPSACQCPSQCLLAVSPIPLRLPAAAVQPSSARPARMATARLPTLPRAWRTATCPTAASALLEPAARSARGASPLTSCRVAAASAAEVLRTRGDLGCNPDGQPPPCGTRAVALCTCTSLA